MLSIQVCKNELTKNEECYTDEEIKIIREILYELASIEIENYKALKNDQENNQSNHLCEGFNR